MDRIPNQSNPLEQEDQADQAPLEKSSSHLKLFMITLVALLTVIIIVGISLFATRNEGVKAPWLIKSRIGQVTTNQGPTGDKKAYRSLQSVSDKPPVADKEGGLTISAAGMGKKIDKVPTVQIFVDPMCPWCGKVGRVIDPEIGKMVKAGQINATYTFLSFLDKASTDHYSTRVDNALATVAEKDPDHFLAFEAAVFEEDFQPGEGDYQPVSDEKLAQQALKAGVSESVTAEMAKGRYLNWVKKVNDYTITREDAKDAKGEFSTPTILINGQHWDITQAGKDVGGIEHLDKALVKALGLKQSEVGHKGSLPSIGSYDGALPVK